MTASFGRLENETLTLEPGLNVLARPNEAGKSTWAAFLIAMLYGVDTAERAKQGVLPAKTKYKPWSGKPMQGAIELETDDGRRLRIERTSRGRTPMGEFAAYDMDTGLPADDLTAENCGVQLLGVERSVFVRSAFIHQSSLALTSDDALERRLSALVTTGDERASASGAAKLLREQKNKIQHNKTGLLPQALREKEQLEDTLAQLRAAHREDLSLRARQEELTARRRELLSAQQALLAHEQAQKLAQLQSAREQADDAARACAHAREKTQKYPAREQLAALRRQLSELSVAADDAPMPPEPVPPDCPAVFQGVAPEAVMDKAQSDGREFDRLTAGRRPNPTPALVFLIAFLLMGVAGLFFKVYTAVAICAAAVVCHGAIYVYHRRNARAYDQNMDKAQEILARYENRSRDELAVYAAQYREQLLIYQQRKAAYDAAAAQRQAGERQRAEKLSAILGAVSVFAPGAAGAPQALQALAQAEEDYAALERAEHALAVAQSRAEALEKAYGALTPADMPPGDWQTLDAAQLTRELSQIERELVLIRSQLDQSRGRSDALGDPAALSAQIEALDAQIAALRQRYAAIELAEQTLMAADTALQTRFAPQIAARAGEYFAALTENRYDRVLLDRQLQLSAGAVGEAGARQLLSLSTGTADQLYLAVRLAMCELLLPPSAPLVLDDALLSFDEARMRAALRLLQDMAARRQILLFSCHDREQAYLAGN